MGSLTEIDYEYLNELIQYEIDKIDYYLFLSIKEIDVSLVSGYLNLHIDFTEIQMDIKIKHKLDLGKYIFDNNKVKVDIEEQIKVKQRELKIDDLLYGDN